MSYSCSGTDNNWQAMLKESRKMRGAYVKVGFPEDKAPAKPSLTGSGHEPARNMQEIAFIAACHEFGTKSIPERRFMRPALEDSKTELASLQKRLSKAIFNGEITTKEGLKELGEFLKEKIRKALWKITGPQLKPMTVQRKNSTKILVDTAQMHNSITYSTSLE